MTVLAPSKKTGRQFTWEEVAKHNTYGDAWASIDGEVYDLTEWVDKHPGGRDVVLWAAGRDATQARCFSTSFK
jgi:cytochrome b involved in lipid metabolism